MFEVPLPGARALFTTRLGGSSAAPYDSRNLGLLTDDDETVVRRNIDQLKSEFELSTMQLLQQVHGGEIEHVSSATTGTIPIADGAITTERLHGLLITGADCPAVMLASENRLAALHCGWRPVAAGIIESAVAHFNGEEIHAAIGPGICQEHFEVGPEVIDAMGVDGPAHSAGRRLDLTGIIGTRLKRAGVGNVHVVNRCTHCEPEYFFSHRRDNGLTGRQAGVAWRI
ncbi:MAG: laccase domain-containing protein [Solirubrobacterales bacterium]|nr:laccase domain-containing protein [Solirubrobacterales bacterium]